jgi:hypothetical protein
MRYPVGLKLWARAKMTFAEPSEGDRLFDGNR